MSLNVLESQRNGEYKKGTVDPKPNSEHDLPIPPYWRIKEALLYDLCTNASRGNSTSHYSSLLLPKLHVLMLRSWRTMMANTLRSGRVPVRRGLFNCKPNPYKRPYTSLYNAIQYNLPNVWVAVGNDQLSGMLESWAQLFITWSSCVLIYRRFSFFEMKHAWEFKVNPTLL